MRDGGSGDDDGNCTVFAELRQRAAKHETDGHTLHKYTILKHKIWEVFGVYFDS